MCKINLILSVLTIIFVLTNGLMFIETNKYLDDQCTLANESEGTCVRAKECTTIRDRNSLTRCEFEKNDLIICCPNVNDPLDEEDTTTIIDIVASDFVMSRFGQILCDNHELRRKVSPNIVGGSEADVGEFPYQAALGYKSNITNSSYEFNCGGSLILDDIVITAAHCAHKENVRPKIVRLGRTSLVDDQYDHAPVVDVGVKKIMVHEQSRRKTRENDIALIKLDRKVEFTSFIQPICIPREVESWNKNLTVTGFGIVDIDKKNKSTWLMKGIVHEVEIEDCRNSYKIVSKSIFDTQICALGKYGADACQGDSGGPLIIEENGQDRLYGITSHGNGCQSALPALYTKVNSFLTWIEKTIEILDQI